MISLIVACDLNHAIGYKNQLLVKLPNDMKHFRRLTEGNICVMGRKTFESIGYPLPNRTNIILTRDRNYSTEGCYIYNSIEDILHEYHNYGEGKSNVYICGGSEIYEQFIPYADRIYITLINHIFRKTDTFFPTLDDSWKMIDKVINKADHDNPHTHYFITYEKTKIN